MPTLLLFICLTLFASAAFGSSVAPGIYVANITTSISNGTTPSFVVFSSTGLDVAVNTTSSIYANSTLNITWAPFASAGYNATLKVIPIAGFGFSSDVIVSDNGTASVPLSDFALSLPPGFYNVSVNSSLGFGISNTFTVLASTNLTVSVNPSPIPAGQNASVHWSPANTFGNASVYIVRLSTGAIQPLVTNISDFGFTTVPTDTYPPGAYEFVVISSIGYGNSSVIEITSPLNVTAVPNNITSAGGVSNVSWTPFDTYETTVNLSIYLNNTSLMASIPVPNNGSYNLNVSDHGLAPATYLLNVSSNIGSGNTTIIVYSATGLNVTAVPSNVSSASPISTISWTPVDVSETTVKILVSRLGLTIFSFDVPNTGSSSIDFSSYGLNTPNLYTISVNSSIGTGSVGLNIYSATGLNVTAPNATSVIYNNSVSTYVQWAPFDASTANVTIDLMNQNTFQHYAVNASNGGNASIDLVALGVPAGTYNLSVTSPLGFGQTSMFVIRYIQYLNITSPNTTTSVSNAGLLDIDWNPTNLAGGNVTIFLYKATNSSTFYGPFNTTDSGNAVWDLSSFSHKSLPVGKKFIRKNATTIHNSLPNNVLAKEE